MLQLAVQEGNYLGESWYYVLDCISKVEEMNQLGTGQVLDSEFFNEKKNQRGEVSKAKLAQEQTIKANAELIAQTIDIGYIDLVI